MEYFLNIGLSTITKNQRNVYHECLQKGSAGLDLKMGSGKTLISTLVALKQSIDSNGMILIIVPKTLVGGWKFEFHKFFGDMFPFEILHKEYIKNPESWYPSTNIIITTPEFITSIYRKFGIENLFTHTERESFGPPIKHYRVPLYPYLNCEIGGGLLYSIKWTTIIIDEADNYVGLDTYRCLAMSSLCADYRWLLSGTFFSEPKDDKILAYHLLGNFPNFPRNLPDFRKHIRDKNFKGLKDTLITRDKNIDFVPPLVNRIIISHSFSKEEELIYINVKKLLNVIRDRLAEYKKLGDKVNVKKFSSYVVGMISRLRQCLICPLIPITAMAIDVSDFEKRNELSELFMSYINGIGISEWLDNPSPPPSSRIQSICDAIISHSTERLILFLSYRTILNVISYYLNKRLNGSRPIFTLNSTDNMKRREKILAEMENSFNGILLLTYDIGANGLNLQYCSTVMIGDFNWNASKAEQAIARILRPGQLADKINIYYFTANTGMENSILKLQTSKLVMGKEIIGGPITTDIKKIKIDEIIRLINLEDNITILNKIIS